jgi:hypothetical protein
MALAAVLVPGCYQGVSDGPPADSDPMADGGDGDGGSGDDDGTGDPADGLDIGAQPLHRLNRLEYNNTVRDLLGTGLRPADDFGPDPEANGFDNMAEQLGMSAGLLDGYEKAARDAIDEALDERPVYQARFVSEQLGAPGGYAVGVLWALTGNAAAVEVTAPLEGDYEIVLAAGASVIGPAPVPTAAIEVDGVDVDSFTVGGSAPTPETRVLALTLAPGPHTIRVRPTNWVNDAVANTSNNVLVESLAVRSVELEPGPGRDRIYVCEPVGPQAESCYQAIIGTFAARAWRRPLTLDEQNGLLGLFLQLSFDGETKDEALRLVMRAVMTSPKFLYRLRTTADANDELWLDDYVLASRLSYFLWSSMPDDRLFDMAKAGELATDEGLSEAVTWMLADDKAQALVDGFAEQWLSTRHFAAATPSPEVFPDFDESLRGAMTAESKLFFADFLDNDQPVTDFVRPNFAYLNDRLALHYGLPPVGSEELLRVPAVDGQRRGLLSLGAWLIAQSHAEASSPIRRGLWVSDRVLCSPVPPPPPGIVIEPLDATGATTVREQLEKHRSDPACAGCHAMLDVVGMGFEEYDGVGRTVLDPELDTLGELPDGRVFEGADELSDLYADSEVFAGCLSEKLFIYAVGRGVTSTDKQDLETIAATAAAERLDLPSVIDAIVHTPAFRSPAAFTSGE